MTGQTLMDSPSQSGLFVTGEFLILLDGSEALQREGDINLLKSDSYLSSIQNPEKLRSKTSCMKSSTRL